MLFAATFPGLLLSYIQARLGESDRMNLSVFFEAIEEKPKD